jgi:hypothetical protein
MGVAQAPQGPWGKGWQEKKSRENVVYLRRLANKKYARFFLSAFLGVSRQGKFENTGGRGFFSVRFQTLHRENIFRGRFFSGWIY